MTQIDAIALRRRIGTRIAVAVLLVGSVLATSIAALLLQRAWQADQALAASRVDELATTIVPGIEASLWTVDPEQTAALLSGVTRVPGVAYVVLNESTGTVTTRGAVPARALVDRTFPLQHVGAEPYALGTLRVVVGTEWADERHRTRMASYLVLGLALLLVVSLAFFALFQSMVTRHLRALARHVAAFDPEVPGPPLTLERRTRRTAGDELDVVASSVNGMQSRITEFVGLRKAYEETLEEHRDRLEDLVNERTVELEEKAEALEEAASAAETARAMANASAARFSDFAQIAADGFWETDAALRLTFVSPAFAAAFGLRPSDMVGLTPLDVYQRLYPDGGTVDRYWAPLLARKAFEGQVLTARDANGTRRWFVNQGMPVFVDEVFVGYRGAIRDITSQRQAERELAEAQQRLQTIADSIPALVSMIDAEGRFIFNNRAYADWTGRPLSAFMGKRLSEVYPPEVYATIEPHLQRALAGETVSFEVTGEERMYHVTYVPEVGPRGKVTAIYGLANDVTESRRMQEELRLLSLSDPLTGLANRRKFDDMLLEAIERSERSDALMAVMYLDLDHFKQVNDTHGHEVGDKVLVEFAQRVKRSVRRTDTVARIAGDEFVVVLEGLHDAAEAGAVADKIIAAMQPEAVLGDVVLGLGCTIGLAVRRPGDTDPQALLARADAALYRAKEDGRGRWAMAE